MDVVPGSAPFCELRLRLMSRVRLRVATVCLLGRRNRLSCSGPASREYGLLALPHPGAGTAAEGEAVC